LRDIQTRAIHVIRDSQADVIVAASTAGGKTEAAFLPLISEVLKRMSAEVEGLIYSTSRRSRR
jgi:ATP-dependent Lhr-like helicase